MFQYSSFSLLLCLYFTTLDLKQSLFGLSTAAFILGYWWVFGCLKFILSLALSGDNCTVCEDKC